MSSELSIPRPCWADGTNSATQVKEKPTLIRLGIRYEGIPARILTICDAQSKIRRQTTELGIINGWRGRIDPSIASHRSQLRRPTDPVRRSVPGEGPEVILGVVKSRGSDDYAVVASRDVDNLHYRVEARKCVEITSEQGDAQ